MQHTHSFKLKAILKSFQFAIAISTVFFVTISNTSFAQTHFYEAVEPGHELFSDNENGWPVNHVITGSSTFDEKQITRYNNRTSQGEFGERWFVKTSSLEEVAYQIIDDPSIWLPSHGLAFVRKIRIDKVGKATTVSGEVVYSLDVPSEPCFQVGFVNFVETALGLSGTISLPDGGYTLQSLNPDISVLYKMIPDPEIDGSGCAECDALSSGQYTPQIPINLVPQEPSSTNTCLPLFSKDELNRHRIEDDNNDWGSVPFCQIDIAVAFTEFAAEEVDPEAEAALIVAQMNTALANSNVTNFVYRLVDFVTLPETNILNGTLPNAALVTFRGADDIQNLRDESEADQILVVVQAAGLLGFFGISELNDTPSERDLSIMEAGTGWRFTGPHELAHNHGCKHDTDNATGGNGRLNAFARGFPLNATNTTIMGLTNPPGGNVLQRIQHFSNPNIPFDGSPTGTVDRDNARQLRESGCFMAGLHGDDGVISEQTVFFTVRRSSSTNCAGEFAEWRINSHNCPEGIQSTLWHISVDNGPWQFVGSGVNTRFQLPNHRSIVRVRATFTCVNGTPGQVIETQIVDGCIDPCDGGVFWRNGIEQLPLANREAASVTSMGNGSIILDFPTGSFTEGSREVVVFDMLGRNVPHQATFLNDQLTLSNLPNGKRTIMVAVKDQVGIISTKVFLHE